MKIKRIHLGGWWWAIGVAAVMCALGVTAILWYTSETDWRRAQAAARTRGTATTWEEAGFVAMTPPERAQIDQVLAIGKRYAPLPNLMQRPLQIDAPTAALRAHHQAIPDAFWFELLTAIQALPAASQPLYERITPSNSLDIIEDQRALVRLLAERIRLCPVAELPTTIEAGLRMTRLAQDQTLIQPLVSISCLAIMPIPLTPVSRFRSLAIIAAW